MHSHEPLPGPRAQGEFPASFPGWLQFLVSSLKWFLFDLMQCFTLHAGSYCTKERFLDQRRDIENCFRFQIQNIFTAQWSAQPSFILFFWMFWSQILVWLTMTQVWWSWPSCALSCYKILNLTSTRKHQQLFGCQSVTAHINSPNKSWINVKTLPASSAGLNVLYILSLDLKLVLPENEI